MSRSGGIKPRSDGSSSKDLEEARRATRPVKPDEAHSSDRGVHTINSTSAASPQTPSPYNNETALTVSRQSRTISKYDRFEESGDDSGPEEYYCYESSQGRNNYGDYYNRGRETYYDNHNARDYHGRNGRHGNNFCHEGYNDGWNESYTVPANVYDDVVKRGQYRQRRRNDDLEEQIRDTEIQIRNLESKSSSRPKATTDELRLRREAMRRLGDSWDMD